MKLYVLQMHAKKLPPTWNNQGDIGFEIGYLSCEHFSEFSIYKVKFNKKKSSTEKNHNFNGINVRIKCLDSFPKSTFQLFPSTCLIQKEIYVTFIFKNNF